MNERQNHVFETAAAIPTERQGPAEHTILTFYEAPAGQPQALRTWYYPGDNYGQEFIYPKGRISQIASTREEPPQTASAPAEPPKEVTPPAPAAEPAPQAEANPPAEVAQAAPPNQDQPVETAQNNPPPSPPAPAELPKTASDVPLIALFGAVSVAGAMVTRKLRRLAVLQRSNH
jgi:hypothetical protein